MSDDRFIAVGENIHCTRIFKVGGKYVKTDTESIVYTDQGQECTLPIPGQIVGGEDWKNGKVKHTIVAIWQGMNGKDEQSRKAGLDYVRYMGRRQEVSGASFLDLNVDEYGKEPSERIEAIKWIASAVQEETSIPLSIDSSNVDILEAGLSECDRSKGQPMVNSVSLERPQVIDVARQAKASVIAGAAGETTMPASVEERMKNLDELVSRLAKAGIEEFEIYFDPLVFPISVDSQNGNCVLQSIAQLRRHFGEKIHFAPGLSNISFGMPNRKLLNQVFAFICRAEGLDGGIVDPLQINTDVLDNLDSESEPFALARAVLVGEDDFGMNFITAAREGKI